MSIEHTGYDATIIGAGPAGAALALVLSRDGWRVAMLEAAERGAPAIGETLPGRALEVMAELGLREDFELQGHTHAYARRSVWGSDAPEEQSSIADPYGPGWHLDRSAFDDWLVNRARDAGATVLRPARARAISRERSCFRVTFEEASVTRKLSTRFLVDATGFSSWLSRRLGGTRHYMHRMVGAARWFSEFRSDSATLIEATPHGWWYSAPLPDGGLVAVWLTDAGSDTARAARSDSQWAACLEHAAFTRERVQRARAREARLTRVTGPAVTLFRGARDWLPVGDAAMTLDPLSGQGIGLALRSALAARSALTNASNGNVQAIDDYARAIEHASERHRALRNAVYGCERRFENSAFWKRAREGAPPNRP